MGVIPEVHHCTPPVSKVSIQVRPMTRLLTHKKAHHDYLSYTRLRVLELRRMACSDSWNNERTLLGVAPDRRLGLLHGDLCIRIHGLSISRLCDNGSD